MVLAALLLACGRVKPDILTFTLPIKPAIVLAGIVMLVFVMPNALWPSVSVSWVLANVGGTIGRTVTVKEVEFVLTPLSTRRVTVAVPVPVPVGTTVTVRRPPLG